MCLKTISAGFLLFVLMFPLNAFGASSWMSAHSDKNELFYDAGDLLDGPWYNDIKPDEWHQADQDNNAINFYNYETYNGTQEIGRIAAWTLNNDSNFFHFYAKVRNNVYIQFFADALLSETYTLFMRKDAVESVVIERDTLPAGFTQLITATPQIDVNVWYDINITRDENGYFNLYVDGNYWGASAWPDLNYRSSGLVFVGVDTTQNSGYESSDTNESAVAEILIYEKLPNVATDVNLNADFNTFGYFRGGSDHNVQFAVHDIDDNAGNFLVDFNVNTAAELGTGTVVFSDKNLSIDFNYAPGEDTNDLGLFDVNFYYLWTVASLDANYYGCINVKDMLSDANYGECSALSFYIDSTAPATANDCDLNNLWQNVDANIQFHCFDSGDVNACGEFFYSIVGDANYSKKWGDQNIGVPLASDGNFELFYWSSDIVDNNGASKRLHLAIDKTAPTTDHNAYNAATAWFNNDLNINFVCSDSSAGCRWLYYDVVGDANYKKGWGHDANIGIEVTADGNTEIFFHSDDNSFGVGDNNEASTYLNIGLDTVKPITEWNKDTNAWYNSNQTVALTCRDATSGCKATKYRYKALPSGAFTDWQSYTNPIVFDVDGQYHLDFNSTDAAENVGDKNTMFLFIDKVAPVVSSDVNSDAWNLLGDANLQMTAYDATSGIDANYYRIDDCNTSANCWGSWKTFSRDGNILVSNAAFGDGNFGVQYFVSDNASLDSNSDSNSTLVYVLLDVNGPEWPVSVTPTAGNYVDTVTVTCSKQIWVRGLNYVIDFNTDTLDWNTIYIGTNNYYTFDINYMAANTKVWFRCKHIDPDKNSGYYVSPTNIVAEADTGFDSISDARPLANTTIYSASAPFSVEASDPNNTSFCTFQVYKNETYDGDFNGTPPAGSDTNNGKWAYTYTDLVNGNTVYAYIYCQDGQGNSSAKISTATYSVSITEGAPAGPGGPGGIVSPAIRVVIPSLADITASTNILNLRKGYPSTYRIVIESLSSGDMDLSVEMPAEFKEFVVPLAEPDFVATKEVAIFAYEFSMPEDVNEFEAMDANVYVNLNNQELVALPLRLQMQTGFDINAIGRFFGVPVLLIVAILCVLAAIYLYI